MTPDPKRAGYVLVAAACLWPAVEAPMALAVGLAWALVLGNPFDAAAGRWSSALLKIAVVGLGFGLPLGHVVDTGVLGLWVTGTGVAVMLAAGLLLGRMLGVAGDTRMLVASGTAICGGSAIAAVAPVVGARREAISVSLGLVFVLNAVALYAFPAVGAAMGLSERAFALWSAIAIHDTSSVVGAASVYGSEALEQATVLKLARALWIVPLVVGLAFFSRTRGGDTDAGAVRPRVPWFIGLFVLAAALRTLLPGLEAGFDAAAAGARRLLVLVLFLIGSGLSLAALRAIGWRPLVQGIVLWLVVSVASLVLVRSGLLGAGL